MNDLGEEEDEFGHLWGTGWEDSTRPHPGFGGTMPIYGGYVGQCQKCGMYAYEFEKQICAEKVREV